MIAAAAAIAGLTKCVLPPGPCLPSKLRFDVDADRAPGANLSAFMAKHIEQPASRHSNPASNNILSNPSSSAISFTSPDPGTTNACTPLATLRPLAITAAARMSSIRLLVQEPIKAVIISISLIGVPA